MRVTRMMRHILKSMEAIRIKELLEVSGDE
jgi:hypothetical protein